jgi:hypothetical protein
VKEIRFHWLALERQPNDRPMRRLHGWINGVLVSITQSKILETRTDPIREKDPKISRISETKKARDLAQVPHSTSDITPFSLYMFVEANLTQVTQGHIKMTEIRVPRNLALGRRSPPTGFLMVRLTVSFRFEVIIMLIVEQKEVPLVHMVSKPDCS